MVCLFDVSILFRQPIKESVKKISKQTADSKRQTALGRKQKAQRRKQNAVSASSLLRLIGSSNNHVVLG
jgi:hypothetical protein